MSKTSRSRNNIYLVNMGINGWIKPFSPATHICEHVIPGGNRRVINASPYRVYIIVFQEK